MLGRLHQSLSSLTVEPWPWQFGDFLEMTVSVYWERRGIGGWRESPVHQESLSTLLRGVDGSPVRVMVFSYLEGLGVPILDTSYGGHFAEAVW